MKLPMSAFLILLLITACSKPQKAMEPAVKVGDTDSQGRLIIYVYKGTSPASIPVPLRSDYGVMMYRKGGEPHFLLAERKSKKLLDRTDYNAFLDDLQKLPSGTEISIYDRCTVPHFYDFYPVHRELAEKFAAFCEKHHLKIDEESKITCTCVLF